MEYFESSQQHLFAELERIDLLIAAQVTSFRQDFTQDQQFRGLYIPEEEVNTLLAQPTGLPLWAKATSSLQFKAEQLDKIQHENFSRSQRSLNKGIELRLAQLQKIFDLDQFDIDILLICLAVEVDLRYETLYAYLQDDVTKKRPSVDLVLNLLSSTPELKFSQRSRFHTEAPLVQFSLLKFIDESSQQSPLLSRYLKVDDRIVRFLFGSDEIDEGIYQFAMMYRDQRPSCRALANDSVIQLLDRFQDNNENQNKAVFYLRGPYGTGKLNTAQAVCRKQGTDLLVGDIQRIALQTDQPLEKIVRIFHREARLQNSVLYWRDFDSLLDEKKLLLFEQFVDCMQFGPAMTFLAGEHQWEPADKIRDIVFASIEMPKPPFTERKKIWASAFDNCGLDLSDCDIAAVASKFTFTGGQILDAVASTKNLMKRDQRLTTKVAMQDIYHACRLHSNQKLSALARKITPHFKWHDIILPVECLEQLREICKHVKHRNQVYNDWGFDDKLALGKGLNVLFVGPSGTGKTMASEIIAGELDLDLFKIDLSMVVSKYIGETEKNLARIFSEAETSNAILFFDEADALFGKRSEVKDAHDRYANIETAYLLQRMEEYQGVVILATNLRKNMDEAFVRRLNFTVGFPFPEEADRLRIWEVIFPVDAPRDPKLDLKYFASQFEVSGGNIRNIALAAAFFAADESGVIDKRQLLRAAKREYQKMGKVIGQSEFIATRN